ncbi:threonine synthase [Bacillus spizizenii]|nr:threonine synthase [Bacillus spizizenii]MCY8227092.1 threonine synthase [Bacillus spizizenii]MCY8891413.1 threonine synthase [Bacillus spizizenii]MEC0839451.1 threonine synthase [Bacillus spizizenii]
MKLVCIDCGQEMSSDDFKYQCSCGGLVDIVHDFSHYDTDHLKHVFHERLSERMSVFASGVWRYKELIYPDLPVESIVTKYEGNTGLYCSEMLSKYTGVRKVYLKAQSENPSGSFKDNGMTVAVSHGKHLGYEKYACTSTGNTSSSLGMYASIANASSYVFVPDKEISINKVLQTAAYGGNVFSIPGTYDDGIRFLEKYSGDFGFYICNSINPFRIEGQKSIIYEIAQYLDWKLPDWIIVPGGALSNATALGKGLRDLYALNFIDKIPRVAIIQAEGASPFHQMISKNKETIDPEPFPYTRASALNIGNPPSWKKARKVLEDTNGITVSVTDEDILDAKAIIDRTGVGCEPASASTAAGLRQLRSQQVIDKDESVLCILTGNILKDTGALHDYHFGKDLNGKFKNNIKSAELSFGKIKSAMETIRDLNGLLKIH